MNLKDFKQARDIINEGQIKIAAVPETERVNDAV